MARQKQEVAASKKTILLEVTHWEKSAASVFKQDGNKPPTYVELKAETFLHEPKIGQSVMLSGPAYWLSGIVVRHRQKPRKNPEIGKKMGAALGESAKIAVRGAGSFARGLREGWKTQNPKQQPAAQPDAIEAAKSAQAQLAKAMKAAIASPNNPSVIEQLQTAQRNFDKAYKHFSSYLKAAFTATALAGAKTPAPTHASAAALPNPATPKKAARRRQ